MSDGVTIIVPAYNEAEGITPTLEALAEVSEKLDRPVEILVVDDGSSDETGAIAKAAGARVLRHPTNGGYGHALGTGIRAAQYPLIAIADADGTYPIDQLETMLPLMDSFDMVIGARTGRYYLRHALLSPMRTAFLLLTRFVCGIWIPDPNSGLRIFRRDDVLALLGQLPRGFSFTTTMTLIMTLNGRFIHYHRVPYHRRIGHSKVRIIRDALRVGQTMVEVVLRHNPLKLFLLLALVPALGLPVFPLALGATTTTYLATLILLCSSVLIFALGMVAVVWQRRDR